MMSDVTASAGNKPRTIGFGRGARVVREATYVVSYTTSRATVAWTRPGTVRVHTYAYADAAPRRHHAAARLRMSSMGYLYAAFLRSPIEPFGFPRSYEVRIRTYTPCVSCGSVACQGAVLHRVFRSTPPGVLLPEGDSWRLKILFVTYAFSIDRVPQGMNSRCDLCSSLQGLVDGLSSGQSLHFTVAVRMRGAFNAAPRQQ